MGRSLILVLQDITTAQGIMFFRKKSAIKRHWTRLYQRSLVELNELIEEDYPWSSWEANSFPEGTAEFEFDTAIRILAGSDNWDLARRYLDRSIEIVDRILEENKLTSPGCDLRYPANSAVCRRTKVYAQSLLGGALDRDALILASREFEAYYEKHDDPRDRNEQSSYHCIDGIHLALIGNDLEQAAKLLNDPHAKDRFNKPHFSALKGLVTLASGSAPGQTAREIVDRFETFFNRARDPRTKMRGDEHIVTTIGPLELAVIRDRYVHHGDEDLDWKRIIAQYSR